MNKFASGQRLVVLVLIFGAGIMGIISTRSGWAQASSAPPAPGITNDTPRSGNVNTTYWFSAPLYPDPDGNLVQAVFDWGDGSPNYTSALANFPSGYSGSMSFDASHSWNTAGTYYIKVKAVDSTGLSSAWTSFVTMTISVPPAAPTEFFLNSANNLNERVLNWIDNSNNETEFRIERRFNSFGSNSGSWLQIATVGANVTTYKDNDLSNAGTYDYRGAACNSAGCSSWSNMTSRTIPAWPPVPSGLTATDLGPAGSVSSTAGSVSVNWTDNSTNEFGFRLYRRVQGSTSWSRAADVVNNSTGSSVSFTDVYQFVPNTTYEYTVHSYNTYESDDSNIVTVSIGATTSGDTTLPSTPTQLSAYVNSSAQISISWVASTDNVGVTGYKIYRDGVEIGWRTSALTPAYSSAGLSAGTTYTFTVAAQDAAGNLSAQSASVSATTLSSATLTAPAKPSIFTAYASGSNVSLYWEGNYPYPTPESEAKVYRRLQGSSSWILIYSKSYNPAYIGYDRYTDAGLANATYEYHINFCNSGGCSADSNTATVIVGAVATATTTLSPIGYWKFDGNGNNEIAGGPSAVTVGSASFNSSGGKLGGYAYIPGSSDWLKIPYNSIFDLPDYFTIEFWFRQRAERSFLQNLVYKGAPTNNYNFYIYRQLWNQYNYGPVIAGHTAANTGFWTQPSNPNQLAHNEWHHVVFTKSPSYHAYYLDGTLIGSKDVTQYTEYSGPAKTPHNDIIIGDSAVDTDIDNLRIYNRALSLDEVLVNGSFAARVRVCEQGAKQCSGANIQECSSDGYSWNITQYCSYGCNSNTLSCNSAPTATSTTSTTTTAPAPSSAPVSTPPPTITPTPMPASTTFTPTTAPTSAPIAQCLQAGGLWCYSDFPSSLSGYCAPAKSACERGDQAPRAVLPQPSPAVVRAELQTQEQFLAERRAVLQDLRELERLVRRDIIEIDAKQLKNLKDKILSLKPRDQGDLSVLQNYQEQITSLQGDASTNTERESTIDPRQESRALQQLKQGLRLLERHIATIQTKVAQIEKSKITVDASIKETIVLAKDMARRVKVAKSYNDIRDIAEQIPDVGQALNDALPRLEELLRLPRVLRLVDRRIADGEIAIKQASAAAKRLKLDVADKLEAMRGLVAGAKSTVVAVKTGGATEGLLDTLQEQVFDTLDDVFNLADHIRAVASVRQSVNQATANVKRYELRLRRLKAGSEDRQTVSELLGKFKEQLAGLKELSAQKLTPDIGDQIIDNLNVMEDLKTELEDILNLSSPDAVQKQIKRLFSAPGEKIKPFKVEQLEQGVL